LVRPNKGRGGDSSYPQDAPPITQRHMQILEIRISQFRQNNEIDAVFRKQLGVFGQTVLLET
jgi:hypothetical protein